MWYYILFFSDFTLKLVDVDNCSHKTFQGHEAPILSVAIDPKEEFIVRSNSPLTYQITCCLLGNLMQNNRGKSEWKKTDTS